MVLLLPQSLQQLFWRHLPLLFHWVRRFQRRMRHSISFAFLNLQNIWYIVNLYHYLTYIWQIVSPSLSVIKFPVPSLKSTFVASKPIYNEISQCSKCHSLPYFPWDMYLWLLILLYTLFYSFSLFFCLKVTFAFCK